ncbi:hypothetical protein [Curtobacterium luteum]|uniref:Uncharacterized protein n=1 Tax=Curtobacterium luteum TaxID=33881 RepID=A0A175S481_9MICO|nr:hypothetical protein [Curtobacterium luteum]KTR11737.1 hypothetical protein NS184_00735 [Curtobacterium luteum]
MIALVLLLVGSAGLTGALIVVRPDRRRGFVALVAVGLLVAGGTATAPETVQDVAQLGAAALFALGIVIPGTRPVPPSVRPALLLMCVFGVVVLITTAVAFPAGLTGFAKLMLVAVTGFVCVARFGDHDRSFFLGGLVGIAALEATLGIAEFAITKTPIPWGFKLRADGSSSVLQNPLLPGNPVRVSGSLGHPIAFGSVIGAALLIVIARDPRHAPVRRWALIVLFVVAIILSGSRSVLLGVVIGVVVLLWSARPGAVVRVFAVISVAVVGGIVFASGIAAGVARLVGSGSYTNRASSIESVPLLLTRAPLESLFGSGFGSEFDLYRRGFFPQDGFMIIDNQLVTTLGTEGIVGAVLVIALFVVGWVRGTTVQRGLLAFLAVMLFSFDYFGWFVMFALLAIVLALPPAGDADVDEVRRRVPEAG